MVRTMRRQIIQLTLAIALVALLSSPTLAANAEHTQSEMLRSARMWEAKDRPDLARTILEKALLTKEDPEVLLLLTCLELRSNNTKLAAKYLQQLELHYPQHPNISAMRNLYRVYTTEKQTLARLRLMARAGIADEAAKAMHQLFPDGPPPEALGLEYYQIIGNVKQGQQSAMTALAKRYKETGESRYHLEWLKLRGGQAELQESLHDYESLAVMPDVNRNKLREDWWLVLKRLPMDQTSQLWVSHFLREFSDDQKAISFMADLQQNKELSAEQKSAVKLANLKKPKDEPTSIVNDAATLNRQSGLAYLEQGQNDHAEHDLQKSLLMRPNDVEVLAGIGLIRLRQGNQDEALTWFKRAASFEPNSKKLRSLINTASFWQQMKLADSQFEAGKLPEALQAANQAIAIDPNSADALTLLGNILAQSNNQKEAENLYHAALNKNASSTSAMRGLLTLLSRNKRHHEALALINEFHIKNPQEAQRFSEMQAKILRDEADSYLSAHRPTHALQALETAILLAPSDAWIRYDLANLYQNMGLPVIGQGIMAEGAKLTPDDESMNYAYALVLASQNNEAEALARLSRIPKSAKTDTMNALETRLQIKLHIQRAKILFTEGKLEEAIHEMTLAELIAAGNTNAIEQVVEGWFDLSQPARGIALMTQSQIDTKIATSNSQLNYAKLLNRAKQDDSLASLLPDLYQRSDWSEKQLDTLLDIETDVSVRLIERLLKEKQDAKARTIAAKMPVFGKTGELATLKSQARLLIKANDYSTALPLLMAILEKQPNAPGHRLDLARAYYYEGDKDAAQNTINELLARSRENDIDTHLSIAQLEVQLGYTAQARQVIGLLLTRYPSNPDVLMQAGYIEQADQQYDAALMYFRRVKALGAGVKPPELGYNATP